MLDPARNEVSVMRYWPAARLPCDCYGFFQKGTDLVRGADPSPEFVSVNPVRLREPR